MSNITIRNIPPQNITIGGGGSIIGVTTVYVNGVDVTEGSAAYVIVPTKLSELQNDEGFISQEVDPTVPYFIKQITLADISKWNNKQDLLVSGTNIKTINNNSILGSGNLEIDTSYTAGTGIEITGENVINNTITSYDDLTDLPIIPTKTSDLLNDSDYVISSELSQVAFSGSYNDLSDTPFIPQATNDLVNNGEDGEHPFITNQTNQLKNYMLKEYLDNILPKVSGSGTSVTLNDSAGAELNISLQGNTSQDGTPTPSTPQTIHTITGDNTIKVENKNLLITSTCVGGSINTNGTIASDHVSNFVISGNTISFTTDANYRGFVSDYIEIDENETYTLSFELVNTSGTMYKYYGWYDENKNGLGRNSTGVPITGAKYVRGNGIYGTTGNVVVKNIQLEKGTETTYVPHQEQTQLISLGDLEYCDIDDYDTSDEFILATNETGLESGKWYLKKNITNKTLTTSNIGGIYTGYSNLDYIQIYKPNDSANVANYNDIPLLYTKGSYLYTTSFNNASNINKIIASGGNNNYLFGVTKGTTLEEAQTIINGSKLYYILATPTYIPLNDTLQQQLTNIYNNMMSYKEQTNISQTNTDLGFIINANTFKIIGG